MNRRILDNCDSISDRLPLSGGRELDISKPIVMGIINVTPDSFSDGGESAELESARLKAMQMIEEGAAALDIGGESTRPGAESIPLAEELRRVIPVIQSIRRDSSIPISVDTCKAEVAKQSIEAGADMVNDISALRFDSEMVNVILDNNVPVVLMHMQGRPRNMQENPSYVDCVGEIAKFFEERISFCEVAGIRREKLILDPGIGFGKRLEHNLEILAGLNRLRCFNLPLMIGASRKSFIGLLHDASKAPAERIGGSIAAATVALINGADILRVHDVDQTVEAMNLIRALKGVQ